MFQIEQYSLNNRCEEYMEASMLSRFSAGTGRLYFSSPNFCIDVSTSRVNGLFETMARKLHYSDQRDGHWMARLSSLRVPAPTFRLQMDFEMDGAADLIFPFQTVRPHYSSRVLRMDDFGDTALLVDSSKMPKPIWRPIWLPGGVWQCAYCASSQLHDLLQCRNCGAPRYDDLRKL